MRAPWLELDSQFEGVGAHPLNFRYDPVDEEEPEAAPAMYLPLLRARRLIEGTVLPRLDGHDGSHHQYDAGPVDLDVLAAATWIVWWKATQSIGYTDPTFLWVWGRRELWTHRGAYHWLSSTTDPERQAAHYVQVSGDATTGDLGMLDAEEAGITVPWCLGWLEAVEAKRKRPQSVYSGLYVAGGSIWRSPEIREGKYGRRPMHLAAYVTEDRLRQLMISTGNQNNPMDAWQFSSNGPVPGITGRADMNRVDNRAAFDRAAGITASPVPQPQPEDDMAIITNLEPHTLDGADYPAGIVKWVSSVTKRHIGPEEWTAVYGGVEGAALSNAALALIPDHKEPSSSVDEAARREIADVKAGLVQAGSG